MQAMTLMAVPVTGVLGTIYDLAETDEGSAQLLLQMGVWEALHTEIAKADWLEPALAGHFARLADGMLEKTAQAYTIAKAHGEDTSELEAIAEHLAVAKAGWVTVGKMTPQEYDAYVSAGRIQKDPETGRFVSRGVRGRVLQALGLASSEKDSEVSRKTTEALNGLVGDQQASWNRMRALGTALQSSPSTASAGTAARLAADIGPEAQRILEPGIRRTAYRYRGTEKRPSRQAQTDAMVVAASSLPDEKIQGLDPRLQQRIAQLSMEAGASSSADTRALMTAPGRRAAHGGPLSPAAAAIAANPKRADWTEDQLRLARTSDYGALMLRKQVPSVEDATISLAAGKMPPSVGMMFDGDGRLVSEAMGYNGDHYLPFDLRNLKRLKGGSYVRTRTTGGLTDEDIYTGLMTGARQVTVVSNSGVFTAEFDPDLRGGRRYSDKARQMVGRYAALTSVIGGGKLQQTDLPRERLEDLRRDAMAQGGDDPDSVKSIFAEMVEAERFKQNFAGLDDDQLMDEATAIANEEARTQDRVAGSNKPGSSIPSTAQRRAQVFRELKAQAVQQQAKNYRLDFDGYTAAQRALKTEFPYFLRDVRSERLHEFLIGHRALEHDEDLPRRGGRDLGYTQSGELAPLKDYTGRANLSEQARTGRRPAPVGTPGRTATEETQTEETEQETPAARTTATAAGGAVEQAMSFEEAVEAGQARLTDSLADALRPVLKVRSSMNIPQEGFMGSAADVNVPVEVGDPQVLTQSPLQYLDWAQASFKNSREYAVHLADNPEEAELLRDGVAELKEMVESYPKERARINDEQFDDLTDLLDLVGGTGFAEVEHDDPVLQRPDLDTPQPVLYPEIEELGASKKNITAYARRHPKVLAIAAEMAEQDPNEVAEDINDRARTVQTLLDWGGKGDPPRHHDNDRTEAQRLVKDRNTSTLYTELRDRQLAWALVKANQLTELATDRDGVDFAALAADAGPKVPVTAEKRLVVHSRGSAVAKGLANRLR